jgi:hypothetical protein
VTDVHVPVPGTAGVLCTPNISSPERRKRLIAGVVQFAIGAVILRMLIGSGVDRRWRLALLVPFWSGAIGVFQWWDKT